eukprot:m.170719 g.170719  ORF g.170719 m.170719 type:complete len:227 (-) comp13282_c0_seq1:149-829(-)
MAGAAVPTEDVLNKELVLRDLLQDHHGQHEHDGKANMYAILRQLEFIENANAVGVFNDTPEVYEKYCDLRLRQYSSAKDGFKEFDLEKFMNEYDLQLDAVVKRIKAGVNANKQYEQEQQDKFNKQVGDQRILSLAVEIGQQIVSLNDTITMADKENGLPVPDILPEIALFVRNLERFPGVSQSAELAKIRQWERVMKGMGSTDVLTEEQMREIEYDIDKMNMEVHR